MLKKKSTTRNTVREAVALHKSGKLDKQTLRLIATAALYHEMSASLNEKMYRNESKLTDKLERPRG
jgi:hypothetical protein